MEDKHALGCKDYDKAFIAWQRLLDIGQHLNMDIDDIDDIVKIVLDYIYYSNFEGIRTKDSLYEVHVDLLETKE